MDINKLNAIAAPTPGFVNELRPEYIGMQSLCATHMFDSSSRAQMHTSHFSQRIVLNNHDEKILQSGVEKKFSPHTFNIKMPEDGRILKVIHKYDPKGSINAKGRQHTRTVVIYQKDNSREVDCFEIPYHNCNHQIFGFKYVESKENTRKIQPGQYIPKGTIFADAPTVGKHGSYNYGLNANVAFMSTKAVAEDGFVVADRFMDRAAFKITEVRTFGVGKDSFAVNSYGDVNNHQPMPHLGQNVREDGIIFVSRKYDTELNPVEMSIFDMQEINYIFDKQMYVKAGCGRVIDITVIRNNEQIKKHPNEISGFLDMYADAYVDFNRKIYEAYLEIAAFQRKQYNIEEAEISPRFTALVVDAMAICNIETQKIKQPLRILHRKQPIDEYHIEVTVEHDIIPNIAGFKLTDQHGSKGVVCKVIPWQQMPRDKNGVYADVITDAASVISRMNIGRLYDHQIMAASRDVTIRMRRLITAETTTKEDILKFSKDIQEQLWEHFLTIYACIGGKPWRMYSALTAPEDRAEVLEDAINTYIKLIIPIDHEKNISHISRDIEKYVKPTYDVVTFNDPETGIEYTSSKKIRIGMAYLMVLNKIADDGSSVAIAKQQHFGVPTSSTKHDKYANAWRNSPVRTDGESEVRIKIGYCGPELQAETMDMSNSTMTQRELYNNLLLEETPSNIPRIIDRKEFPLGTHRPVQTVQHSLMCAGLRMEYVPDNGNNGETK